MATTFPEALGYALALAAFGWVCVRGMLALAAYLTRLRMTDAELEEMDAAHRVPDEEIGLVEQGDGNDADWWLDGEEEDEDADDTPGIGSFR